MNPDARTLWQAPRWALAILLACLGMLGPFSIDTYLPAFTGIARAIGASPVEMQQTLSAYLFGFAVMNLFHGALSDSFGRRPVVLSGLAVFTLASVGCALSQHIGHLVFFRALQGMSAGAGIVVSRAVIRDMFPPADAQRVMSQVTIYFGVAPAIAPMIGGFLFVHAGWHAIFWLLTAIGVLLFAANWRLLPETLHSTHKQPFNVQKPAARLLEPRQRSALRDAGAGQRRAVQRHVPLRAVDAGLPRRHPRPRPGPVLLVLRPHDRRHRRRRVRLGPHGRPRQGDLADPLWLPHHGRHRRDQPGLNPLFVPEAWWALVPIALYAFGWALMVPVVTLMVLDLVPERRGMASSLQAFVGSAANGLVAGVIAPLVMHSALALAATSLAMLSIGVVAWLWVKPRIRIGSTLQAAHAECRSTP